MQESHTPTKSISGLVHTPTPMLDDKGKLLEEENPLGVSPIQLGLVVDEAKGGMIRMEKELPMNQVGSPVPQSLNNCIQLQVIS